MVDVRILNEIENEVKDVNYKEIRETEAKVGGIQLPTGLEKQLAFVDSAVVSEEENRISYRLSCKAITPDQYRGASFTLFYNFGPSFNNAGAQVRSKHQNIEDFTNDMKLMGFDAGEFDSVTQLLSHVDEVFNNPNDKKQFLYNTLKKLNKSGYPIPVVSGQPETGQQQPKARPTRGKAEPPALEVGDEVETINDHFGDGEIYYGQIQSVDGDTSKVKFHDDNSVDDIPVENLIKTGRPQKAETDETAPFDFGIDDEVLCPKDYFGDGEQYAGRITHVNGSTCTVEFEDGEIVDIDASDLVMP